MGNSVKAMSFIGSGTELQLLTCQLLQHFIQQLCVYQHDQRNGKISRTSMWAVSGYRVVSISRLPKNSTSTTSSGRRSTTVGSAPWPSIVKTIVASWLQSRFQRQSVSIKLISNKYLVYSLLYLYWSFHCKISPKEDCKNAGFPLHHWKALPTSYDNLYRCKELTHFLRCC